MRLREARCTFSRLVPRLIVRAHELGYEVAIDYVKRCGGCKVGKSDSLHKSGLAIDLHLYKDGKYQSTTEAHEQLGAYWESLHPNCSWGGRFNDGNHYSFQIDSRR